MMVAVTSRVSTLLFVGAIVAVVKAVATPPNVSVSGLSFADLDLDGGEVGGTITWTPPEETADVTGYSIGLASSAQGDGLISVGHVALGTNTLLLPVQTLLGSATHVVVYAANGAGAQDSPSAAALVDVVANAQDVAFADADLDGSEVGGNVSWAPPANEVSVTDYVAYLATNAQGANRVQLGGSVAKGINFAVVPVDTALGLYTHLLVYARSSLAEQTTPASALLIDVSASVTNLEFVDKDLDINEIGGSVTWQAPVMQQVEGFVAYWSEDANGSVRTELGTVGVGTNAIQVAAETALTSKTHILLYSKSWLAEQSQPVALSILDRVAKVAQLAFADADLDAAELGGNVTWTAPLDASQVTHYRLYLALSAAGASRQQLGADVPVATSLPHIPLNTAKGSFTHLLVYTVSSVAEQTTPSSLLIADAYGGVSNVGFADQDLDTGQLGGTVSWLPPTDTSQVLGFSVYLATAANGAGRSVLGSVPLHTNKLAVPVDSPLDSFTYVVVFATSAEAEQSTPSSNVLTDTAASVSGITFSDQDLDTDELGGTVTWSAPGDLQHVLSYSVFLATSTAGAGRVRLHVGDLLVGTNTLQIPSETQVLNFTHIVVFAASALGEQNVPAAEAITDNAQSVSSISFTDMDLDLSELGGTVLWSPPAPLSIEVTHYVVYLAENALGTGRVLVGPQPMGVSRGTNHIAVVADTAKAAFTHVVVFTRSALCEQTVPVSLALQDQSVSLSSLSFTDLDADAAELGGSISWSVGVSQPLVTHYAVYLAVGSGSSVVSRSKLGSDIVAGTNTLTILADTPLGVHTHLAVYAKSSLAEQTKPAGDAPINDLDGTVQALNFGDRDFDIAQIGGAVTWQPPPQLGQITHYTAHLAKDAAGMASALIGNEVPVGTNLVTLPVSTPLESYTHVVVYAKTVLGFQTKPAAVPIADTPLVGTMTRWTIANAEATASIDGGGWSVAGAEWTVQELELFSDSACSQAVGGSRVASGHTGQYHGPQEAFDGSADTAWHAQCAPCTAFEAWLGVDIADVVRCVRWVQSPVLSGKGVARVAFQIGGQELARASGLQGGRWEGLRYAASGGGWQLIR